MNPRSTGILAIVAALLGGFIYFYEIGGEVGRKAAEQAENRVFADLEADSIESISMQTQDGVPVRFARVNGVWELREPIRGPADAVALDAMTSVLVQLAIEGRIADPGALSEYGLSDDARTIRFEAGGVPQALRIGRSTPIGGHLYVTSLENEVASNRVSYVESFRINAFNRNLRDLRDRRVLPFEPAGVTEIALAWPEVDIELAKRGEEWWMLAPVEERADQITIRDLLRDLSYLRAEEFIDEEDAATAAAMQDLSMEFRLNVAGSSLVATVGGRATAGNGIDAARLVRGRSGGLFGIDEERFDEFERTLSAYRDRTLSEFDVASARRAVLVFEANPDAAGHEAHRVVARLGDLGWKADGIEIDTDRFSDMIQALAQLRAQSVVAEDMGPSELSGLGLSPPQASVRIEALADGGEAEPLAEIAIGRAAPSRGIYAQRLGGLAGPGDSKIYLLDPGMVETLPISWAAFESGFVSNPDASSAAAREEVDFEREAGFDGSEDMDGPLRDLEIQ